MQQQLTDSEKTKNQDKDKGEKRKEYLKQKKYTDFFSWCRRQ